jgi:hypothetical protein
MLSAIADDAAQADAVVLAELSHVFCGITSDLSARCDPRSSI